MARDPHPKLPTPRKHIPPPGAPGHAHWRASCTAAAGLFSVMLNERYAATQADAFVDALRLFGIGYSWAGPISLVVPYDVGAMRDAGHSWKEVGRALWEADHYRSDGTAYPKSSLQNMYTAVTGRTVSYPPKTPPLFGRIDPDKSTSEVDPRQLPLVS